MPGWVDVGLFQQLSFYTPYVNFKAPFYGDWEYDELHQRVTSWTDEFGEKFLEEDAGPQTNFEDDVTKARDVHGDGKVVINEAKTW